MVSSKATSITAYLDALPQERRAAIESVRDVICKYLPRGYEEGVQYGMLGYYVPLSRYPDTYNGQPLAIACLASQKNYMSLYLMAVYEDRDIEAWFTSEYKKAGKKLDMGKSCVRFKTLADLPLDLIGKAIARVGVDDFIAMYEASRKPVTKRPARAAKRVTQ